MTTVCETNRDAEREAARRLSRLSELTMMKGRTAPGRRTAITDAVYFSYDEMDRNAALPCGMYVRVRTILTPEWCRLKDDQLLREYNGAVIYTCPEIAAENDMYSMSRDGRPNSGASPVRGCLRCKASRLYNLKTASDMKYYFGGTDSVRDMVGRMYNIRRHVRSAEPV